MLHDQIVIKVGSWTRRASTDRPASWPNRGSVVRKSSVTSHHAGRPEPGGVAEAARLQGRGKRKLAWRG